MKVVFIRIKEFFLTLCTYIIQFFMPAQYIPGTVNTADLLLPEQDLSSSYWQMEPEIKLFHFTHGKGKPALVIHGGPGIPSTFTWQGLEGIENYQFFYYDQRGCGKSTIPFNKFSSCNFFENSNILINKLGVKEHITDIERIRRILGVDKLSLISHSYGMILALMYAFEFPTRVENLILVSPACILKMPNFEMTLDRIGTFFNKQVRNQFNTFMKQYFAFGKIFFKTENQLADEQVQFSQYYINALKINGSNISFPEEHDNKKINAGGFIRFGIMMSLGFKYDYRPLLKNIQARTLIIHGGKDIFSDQSAREYAGLIPDAEFILLENASHFAFMECEDEFRGIVDNFLNNSIRK